MSLRTRRNRFSRMRRVVPFWRHCALLMLLVFVWDICFDLLSPLHVEPDVSVSGVGITASGGDTESHPDCGFPDHDCALSHHHHFPALVSTTQFIISAIANHRPEGTEQVNAVHIPQANRLIRAPPAEL